MFWNHQVIVRLQKQNDLEIDGVQLIPPTSEDIIRFTKISLNVCRGHRVAVNSLSNFGKMRVEAAAVPPKRQKSVGESHHLQRIAFFSEQVPV